MTAATATANRAPTEEEILRAITARVALWPDDNPRTPLRDAVERFASFLTAPAYDVLDSPDPRLEIRDFEGDADDIWTPDLRRSEAIVLREIAREAIERAIDKAQVVIMEELVAAGLRFAAKYPDAPRAVSAE